MTYPATDPTPTAWADYEVRLHSPGTKRGHWIHGTAGDGRLMHTAQILNEDAIRRVQGLAASGLAHGSVKAQQRPVLDYAVPGRLSMSWLFNGEWIVLWAPEPAPAVPKPAAPVSTPQTPAQAAPRTPVKPGADAKRLIPGGRLRFGRRANTPKETRT